MKVFFNGVDWVVARNEDEAVRLWEQHTGESAGEYDFVWEECDPQEDVSVWYDPDCEEFAIPVEYLVKVGTHENLYKATIAQWLFAMAAAKFRGFWISTEF